MRTVESARPREKMHAMTGAGSTEFDTAIGRCSIAWQGDTVVAVRLPGTKARPTSDPPAAVQRVIDAIVSLLEGEPVDLTWVPVDMSGVPEFNRRVYEAARTIPVGQHGDVRRRRGAARVTPRLAVGRQGARPQPVRGRRAVSPRGGCGWRSRRLLGGRRCQHKDADARHRGQPAPSRRACSRRVVPRAAIDEQGGGRVCCGARIRSSVS